jgi:hypothetical protein
VAANEVREAEEVGEARKAGEAGRRIGGQQGVA